MKKILCVCMSATYQRTVVFEKLALERIFSEGGGFVFATIHNIVANVPVENIVAMFDAVRDFRGL